MLLTVTALINSWIAVGFLPMTGNAANELKVQFELGEGGAPEAEQKRMRDLYSEYCKVVLCNEGGIGWHGVQC